ncbi:ClpXP protease specificity-enhancing factor [Aliidiomarina sanyensis]|uniref:ClpXP protease specificity-enhancing factor n=1 Tax=Aliidiomarina sanyensis TaxID=1249555 RepID=A0A432WI48_9GAMM|nr:ClpXP protease specificity-enhancing factor [Aliidiomarina sanyensis]RUO33470.1 ClpXP protease specificity-enhancing factor [Aliidiomarina sanyensis]
MTPRRPYILRALYDWLLDNDLTPHLVVDAEFPGTEIPRQYVQDGQIVLNIAPGAVHGLQLENDQVSFRARFGGQDQRVILPMGSLLAIYSRENGAGTIFEPEQGLLLEDIAPELAGADGQEERTEASEAALESDEGSSDDSEVTKKGRPHLTVVK